jgi:single-strand DNA-binding protein
MYQKTVVVGHLGNDPEMRYTPSGVPVTSFSLASTRRWTNQNGEQQEKTTWYRVSVWRKQAETVAEYLKKGRLVLVEGEVEARAYTDRDGNPRASLELTANNIRFLGGRGESAEPSAVTAAHAEDFPTNEDDLPF